MKNASQTKKELLEEIVSLKRQIAEREKPPAKTQENPDTSPTSGDLMRILVKNMPDIIYGSSD